jgi:Primase C terminal 2 (PriCT-2)
MASPRRSFQVFLELPLPPDAAKVLQGGAPTIEVPDAFKVVPDHLKGLPVENELGAGIERPEYPPMTADQLRACTDAIPNPVLADWQVWNTMAMRLYASCDGAPYGLDVLKDWTAKNPARRSAKDMAGCDETWERFHTYPPAETNGGALVNEARRARNDPKWLPPRTQALPSRVTLAAEPPSFVDPWGECVGPPFPVHILPSTLASFVEAQHQAMGADPAALAMAALTAVAGVINAETKIKMGEGWTERPILWTALIGPRPH